MIWKHEWDSEALEKRFWNLEYQSGSDNVHELYCNPVLLFYLRISARKVNLCKNEEEKTELWVVSNMTSSHEQSKVINRIDLSLTAGTSIGKIF